MDFKVKHNCELADFSSRFPSLRVFLWFGLKSDIIELVPEDGGPCLEAKREVSKIVGNVDAMSTDKRIILVPKQVSCQVLQTVLKSMKELNIQPAGPIMYKGGWEHFKTLIIEHDNIKLLLDRLTENGFSPKLLRKTQFDGFAGALFSNIVCVDTTNSVFSGLTEKQIEAILTAHSLGYYKCPRDTDLQAIARIIKIPRTTLQNHLKKAENKIMDSIVPHLLAWLHYNGGS